MCLKIVAGDHSLSQEDAGHVTLAVLKAFPHPDYNRCGEGEAWVEIFYPLFSLVLWIIVALIQLNSSVELSDTIQVANLGNSFDDCAMVGLGADDADNNQGEKMALSHD